MFNYNPPPSPPPLQVKCTQYWPMNGTVIYGGVKVTLESVVNLPNYTIRKLNVTSVSGRGPSTCIASVVNIASATSSIC